MNYIHVHEKCLKCGECRLECEHRTKWTSASTSTPPNTESDKSIDTVLEGLQLKSFNAGVLGSDRNIVRIEQPPNTEPQKEELDMIDKIFSDHHFEGNVASSGCDSLYYGGEEPCNCWVKTAKSQLLAEILKGAKNYDVVTQDFGTPQIIATEQAIPTQYLKELFKETK